MVAEREKLYLTLAANPEIRKIVAKALELEEVAKANPHYLGWEWHEIPVPLPKLKVLVEEGIIQISYRSRSTTQYKVKDPEDSRRALDTIGDGDAEPEKIPENLFDYIVGHDEVKYWLSKSLASPEPAHILLAGPPATAKSLFLEALAELPGAQYALGGSSSRAGIADFLINFQPRFLIIDELDKMKGEDFSALLSLMQSGVVARMKRGLRDINQMTTWVFAGVNRSDRLPPELLSRFITFKFENYTRDEFLEVAQEVITKQHGKDPALARYIVEAVVKRTRDVRQAVQVARLVESPEEVDRFESGIWNIEIVFG